MEIFVELSERIDVVLSMVLANILHAKIIHNKGERDWTGDMLPKGSSAGDGCIVKLDEMGLQMVVDDASGLFEARHAFPNFQVGIAIMHERCGVVMIDNFDGDECNWEFHVFKTGQGGAVIEVFDVQDHEFGIWSGQCAV
jgi:hypothetical protein